MIKRLLRSFFEDLIRHLSGPLGVRLRRAYYSRRLRECGEYLTIEPGVYIENPHWVSVGNWVWIDKHVVIIAGPAAQAGGLRTIPNPRCLAQPGEVVIGDRCHLAIGCVIQGHAGVSIGNSFTASAGSKIYSLSNSTDTLKSGPIIDAGSPLARIAAPVFIGDNVWLGLNCVVLGRSIHDDCFLKPFSLVIDDIPANSIGAGIPARRERERYRGVECIGTT